MKQPSTLEFPGTADEKTCPQSSASSLSLYIVTNADEATDPNDFNLSIVPASGDPRGPWETGDASADQTRDPGEGEFVPGGNDGRYKALALVGLLSHF